jgi:RsiW-degrading membrane proteinase PrsW (M82 family)
MGTGSFADTLTDGSVIATVRALAGPGHVIWSAIAGYYLGLARFNRHYAGPIILKGLLLAIVFHAVYNVLVTEVLSVVTAATDIAPVALFFSFAIGYNGVLFGFLLYKLSRYRAVHRTTYDESGVESELAEFDP